MSVGAILTLGFGSFGTVNLLPTLGYLSSSAPPPSTIPMGGAGHPTGIYWGVKKHKKFTKNLDWLLDRVVSEYYDELTGASAPEAIKKQAAKIVKPYAVDRQTIPETVNWAAMEQDVDRVIAMLTLYQKHRDILDDDEDFMLLS